MAGRERGSGVVCGWPAGLWEGAGGGGARQAPGQREEAGVGEPLAGEPQTHSSEHEQAGSCC